MNKRMKEALATRRFRWGSVGFVASLVFLLVSVFLAESAEKRLDRVEQDPRFGEETWANLSAEEQQSLGRELMSARNNVGQVKMGRVLFAVTLTLSAVLLIVSFVRIKDKVEEFVEKEEKGTGD